jgi:hypothetical protein
VADLRPTSLRRCCHRSLHTACTYSTTSRTYRHVHTVTYVPVVTATSMHAKATPGLGAACAMVADRDLYTASACSGVAVPQLSPHELCIEWEL